jgi:glycerate kinase
VLVAPDKFKGTLSGAEVAAAIASGLRDGGRAAGELPVADGGEGTADALLRALGGEWIEARAADALGRAVDARFAMLADGRAVVEAAEASGLWRIAEAEREPWEATTRGTGELIAAAAEAGAQEVLVAVGGTATTDGGAGALAALEDSGVRIPLTAICDVQTPWERAAALYGPQKGADPATVKRLAARLDQMAKSRSPHPRGVAMTGAGGGLAGGLWARAGARLVAGAPFVLDALGFDQRMRAAAFVVTGEGTIDEQTLQGKAAGEVAVRCRQAGVACHAVVGRDRLDDFSLRVLALDSLAEAGNPRELADAGRRLA